MYKAYAGIGSRETPKEILGVMSALAEELAQQGWTLRSGHADGADLAFELGAIKANGPKEIYLPWRKFNNSPTFYDPEYIDQPSCVALAIASDFHPAWESCTSAAKMLHARNVHQILGEELDCLASMVICWTKDGKLVGGTSQALRIATHYGIPIFNLGSSDVTTDDILNFAASIQESQKLCGNRDKRTFARCVSPANHAGQHAGWHEYTNGITRWE